MVNNFTNIELKPYVLKTVVKINVNQKTYHKMFQRTLKIKHQAHTGFIFGIDKNVPDDIGHAVNIDDTVIKVLPLGEFYEVNVGRK